MPSPRDSLEVSKFYNGFEGDGKRDWDDVRYTHEEVKPRLRNRIMGGIDTTNEAINALYERYSDPKEYPRYQAISKHAREAKEEAGLSDLEGLCTTELSPAWVLENIHSNPEEVVAVAGLLVAARNLAGRFHKIAFQVDCEID